MCSVHTAMVKLSSRAFSFLPQLFPLCFFPLPLCQTVRFNTWAKENECYHLSIPSLQLSAFIYNKSICMHGVTKKVPYVVGGKDTNVLCC